MKKHQKIHVVSSLTDVSPEIDLVSVFYSPNMGPDPTTLNSKSLHAELVGAAPDGPCGRVLRSSGLNHLLKNLQTLLYQLFVVGKTKHIWISIYSNF